jgi:multiple sugar transport system permease protein
VLISAPEKWVGSIGIGSFFGEFGVSWSGVMSASLLFTLPPIVLFLLVQRHFVERIAGGVKG